MKRLVLMAALGFATTAFAQEHGTAEHGNKAHAAEARDSHGGSHSGHGDTPHINLWQWSDHAPPVGWYTVNFIIFIGALVYFTKKPLAAAMKNRHETIRKTIDENQAAYDTAKANHDSYRAKLAAVDQESRELIERTKEDGVVERDRIIATAREYAKRLREDAQNVISQEEERARQRLQHDVARAALKAAEDMLRRGLTDADRDRLFDQSLHMIETASTREAPRRAPAAASAAMDGAA